MYELTANHAVPDARVNWCYPVASELADAVAHGDGHLTVIMLPDFAVWSRFPRKLDAFESLSNFFSAYLSATWPLLHFRNITSGANSEQPLSPAAFALTHRNRANKPA